MSKSHWYVLYTMPQHEKKIAAQLEEEKFSYYLPLCKKTRQWHDRKKVVEMPLFPSYIFVNISCTEDFHRCLSFSGALKFVHFGKEYAKVQEKVILDLDKLCSNSTDMESTSRLLDPGEQVQIKDGPLSGLDCEVVQHNNEKRILMRFHMFNRELLAKVPAELLVV
jgi:transcriptional antiterminator RfaH